jgi:hypothetical protein
MIVMRLTNQQAIAVLDNLLRDDGIIYGVEKDDPIYPIVEALRIHIKDLPEELA